MDTRCDNTAGPALRGFRLQILYTLARLTEPRTALQATLWPEGIEDLAIFDDHGGLREAIQIKGHTAPLTLSELVSKSGNGLLQRAVATARNHPDCGIRLLSFGPFGQELQDAWSGSPAARNRVAQKLEGTGLSPSDVSLLFERVTLERVDEPGVATGSPERPVPTGNVGALRAHPGRMRHPSPPLVGSDHRGV